MLVLTRKQEQSIYIGPHIRVVVVETRDDRVRFGIEAPEDYLILRDEHLVDGAFPSPSPPPATVEATDAS